jgi:hypothetical protein
VRGKLLGQLSIKQIEIDLTVQVARVPCVPQAHTPLQYHAGSLLRALYVACCHNGRMPPCCALRLLHCRTMGTGRTLASTSRAWPAATSSRSPSTALTSRVTPVPPLPSTSRTHAHKRLIVPLPSSCRRSGRRRRRRRRHHHHHHQRHFTTATAHRHARTLGTHARSREHSFGALWRRLMAVVPLSGAQLCETARVCMLSELASLEAQIEAAHVRTYRPVMAGPRRCGIYRA